MGPAWVGPLYWIQWAGGHRRLISPRAADRSGRRTPPPGLCVDAVSRRGGTDGCARLSPVRPIWPKIDRLGRRGVNTAPTMAVEWRVRRLAGRVPGAHSRRTTPGCRVRRPARATRSASCARPRAALGPRAAHSPVCEPATRPPTRAPSWQHGVPVRAVHWLSTACGGGDAVVGGMEQYRRGLRYGRRRRRDRTRRRAPSTRSAPNSCGATPIRSGRSATGAPTRCASCTADAQHPARRPRLLRGHRRAAAGRPVRRARRRAAPSDRLARQLHGRRPGRPPHHRRRRPRGRAPGLPHPLGERHRVRHRRPPARRPHRGQLDIGHLAALLACPGRHRRRCATAPRTTACSASRRGTR